MAREHELKCWPGPFQAVKSGRKPFEYRKNDRDYREGDRLWLREWEPSTLEGVGTYTGEEHRAVISYILRGGEYGVPPGYVVLGLERPTPLAEGGVPGGWKLVPVEPTPGMVDALKGALARVGVDLEAVLFDDDIAPALRAAIAAAPVPGEGGESSSGAESAARGTTTSRPERPETSGGEG